MQNAPLVYLDSGARGSMYLDAGSSSCSSRSVVVAVVVVVVVVVIEPCSNGYMVWVNFPAVGRKRE